MAGSGKIVLLLAFALAFASMPSAADYYVSTTGNDTTGDGSSGNPWATIQFAINRVSAGDTIHIAVGNYTENIEANKSVNLLGAGANNTTISAQLATRHVINVFSNSTNISNLGITGARNYAKAGVYLNYSERCTIRNNTFYTNDYGVHAYYSNNNTIANNTAYSNGKGYYIQRSHSNNLTGNKAEFSDNDNFFIYQSNYSNLSSNTGNSSSYGFRSTSTQGSVFVGNIAKNNTNGYVFLSSNSSNITNNAAENNTQTGFSFSSSNSNNLENNFADRNLWGADIVSSSGNMWNNNSFRNNTVLGISITSSNRNAFTNNTIDLNAQHGIYMKTSANNFTGNTLSRNAVGFFAEGLGNETPSNISSNTFSSNFNSVMDNNFFNNYSSNQFKSVNNNVFDPSPNRSLQYGSSTNFSVYVLMVNQSSSPSVTVNNISTSPEETVSHTIVSNRIDINFTPSRVGLYSVLLNITDSSNNTAVQRFFLGNESAIMYYFAPDYLPTHGQPSGVDSKSFLLAPPSNDSYFWCGEWVQASPDEIPSNITGVSHIANINMSFGYSLSEITPTPSLFGFQRVATYEAASEYGEYIQQNATYQWINRDFDVGYWIHNTSDWYWISLKLKGVDPYWYSNASQRSYINISYLFTSSPQLINLSGSNASLISSTSNANDLKNASIVLEGTGTALLSLNMSNSSTGYYAYYDASICLNNLNCTVSQSNGSLNFTLALGSQHTLNISENKSPSTPAINSPQNNSMVSSTTAVLNATVSDPEADSLTVWFYGNGALLATFSDVANNTTLTAEWGGFSAATSYNWSVVAGDSYSNTSSGTYLFQTTGSTGNGGSSGTSNTALSLSKDFNCETGVLSAILQQGSSPLSGAGMALLDSSLAKCGYQTTDSNGIALFKILQSGTYSLRTDPISGQILEINGFILKLCTNNTSIEPSANNTPAENKSNEPSIPPILPPLQTNFSNGTNATNAANNISTALPGMASDMRRARLQQAINELWEYFILQQEKGIDVASALAKLADAQGQLGKGNYDQAQRLVDSASADVTNKPSPDAQPPEQGGAEILGMKIGTSDLFLGFFGLIIVIVAGTVAMQLLAERKRDDGG